MPGEQEHHIRLYRFSFHKPIKFCLVRGRLYLPLTPYKCATKSAESHSNVPFSSKPHCKVQVHCHRQNRVFLL